jgi:hypothetical protein
MSPWVKFFGITPEGVILSDLLIYIIRIINPTQAVTTKSCIKFVSAIVALFYHSVNVLEGFRLSMRPEVR